MKVIKFVLGLFLLASIIACETAEHDKKTGDDNSLLHKIEASNMAMDTSSDKTVLPENGGYVNDFENLLTDEQVEMFTQLISNFEKKTTNEIAIVTVANTTPYSNLGEYGTKLFNHWGIGKKGLNNGLLLIVSKNKQEVRIATGLGTEKTLTDAVCKEVIEQVIVPRLREGDFAKGIYDGLQALMARWR